MGLGQACTRRLVAEEGVERLFGAAQIGLHLGDEGRHRESFLGFPRHAVEPVHRAGRAVLSECGRLDSRDHHRGARVERIVERTRPIDRAFEKQQRGRDIESDARCRLTRIETEIGGDTVDHLCNLRESAALQRSDRVEQCAGGTREMLDLSCVARHH